MSDAQTNNTAKVVGGVSAAVLAILAAVFSIEGGFVNNPQDPGGATNHGITVAVAKKHGYVGKMSDLPKEMAQGIYFKDYVKAPNFEQLVYLSPAVAEEVIDTGVNVGQGQSSLWFQRSLNALNRGGKDYPPIKVDGKVGAQSFAAYKALQRVRGNEKACSLVIKLMDVQQGMHYMSLTKLNTFMVGWVDHRIGNVPLSKCAKEKVST